VDRAVCEQVTSCQPRDSVQENCRVHENSVTESFFCTIYDVSGRSR